MKLPNKPVIPCFLCGNSIVVKLSKKDKPYLVCEPCGVQAFIRYKPGITKLKRLLKTFRQNDNKCFSLNQSCLHTLNMISRLEELNRKLEQVKENRSVSDYFLSGTDSEMAETALEAEIKRIRNALRACFES